VTADVQSNKSSTDGEPSGKCETRHTGIRREAEPHVILIKEDPVEYYQRTLNALGWVSADPFIGSILRALNKHIQERTQDFWNVHVGLCYLSKTLNPQRYLEIGTRRGRSLFQVLCNADVAKVVSIDPYLDSDFVDLKADVDRFLQATQKPVEILYYQDRSEHVLPRLEAEHAQFDLILVDGSHDFSDATRDMNASHRLLADKGVLILDDVGHMPHLWDVAQNFLETHPEYQVLRSPHLHGCAALYRGVAL
jgi:predicted O-methyltransferase YrrM